MNQEQERRIVAIENVSAFHKIQADEDSRKLLDDALDAYQEEPVYCRQIKFWRILALLLFVAYMLSFALSKS